MFKNLVKLFFRKKTVHQFFATKLISKLSSILYFVGIFFISSFIFPFNYEKANATQFEMDRVFFGADRNLIYTNYRDFKHQSYRAAVDHMIETIKGYDPNLDEVEDYMNWKETDYDPCELSYEGVKLCHDGVKAYQKNYYASLILLRFHFFQSAYISSAFKSYENMFKDVSHAVSTHLEIARVSEGTKDTFELSSVSSRDEFLNVVSDCFYMPGLAPITFEKSITGGFSSQVVFPCYQERLEEYKNLRKGKDVEKGKETKFSKAALEDIKEELEKSKSEIRKLKRENDELLSYRATLKAISDKLTRSGVRFFLTGEEEEFKLDALKNKEGEVSPEHVTLASRVSYVISLAEGADEKLKEITSLNNQLESATFLRDSYQKSLTKTTEDLREVQEILNSKNEERGEQEKKLIDRISSLEASIQEKDIEIKALQDEKLYKKEQLDQLKEDLSERESSIRNLIYEMESLGRQVKVLKKGGVVVDNRVFKSSFDSESYDKLIQNSVMKLATSIPKAGLSLTYYIKSFNLELKGEARLSDLYFGMSTGILGLNEKDRNGVVNFNGWLGMNEVLTFKLGFSGYCKLSDCLNASFLKNTFLKMGIKLNLYESLFKQSYIDPNVANQVLYDERRISIIREDYEARLKRKLTITPWLGTSYAGFYDSFSKNRMMFLLGGDSEYNDCSFAIGCLDFNLTIYGVFENFETDLVRNIESIATTDFWQGIKVSKIASSIGIGYTDWTRQFHFGAKFYVLDWKNFIHNKELWDLSLDVSVRI